MKLLSCELHTCQVLLGTWVVLYESSQCCNLMEAHVLPPNECQEATQLWMVPLETQLLPSAPLPPPATNALCRMKTTTKALEISIFIHNFLQEMHLPWGGGRHTHALLMGSLRMWMNYIMPLKRISSW